MNTKELTLTREDLYTQVWSKPITTLSKEYGISNVGLKKICKKLQVPVPGLGYWQRKRHGQQVKQTPLPKLSDPSVPRSYTIESRNIVSQKPKPVMKIQDEGINKLISQEKLFRNRVRVPKHLVSPHEYIRRTEATAKERKNNRIYGINFAGLLELDGIARLPVKVSPDKLNRLLRIMDALLKALEQRNFKVILASRYGEEPHISLLGEKIRFNFSETYSRKLRELTKEEARGRDLYPQQWTNKYVNTPTGKLRFKILTYADDIKTEWIDSDGNALEEQLNSIIIGLIIMAYKEREGRLERDRREMEWREVRARREEIERQRIEEDKRVQDLFRQADVWMKSKQLREYLKAFRISYIRKNGEIVSGGEVDAWLKWAERCADRADPLTPGNLDKQLNLLTRNLE